MAAFEDPGTLRRAVESGALPTLEALGDNPALLARERRRFDDDLPPPYTSSTEDEPELDPDYLPEWQLRKILDEPLTDAELDKVGSIAIRHYYAGRKMWGEYHAQFKHLKDSCDLPGPDPPLTHLLRYRIHEHRLHILARSAVRKRWQTLGVWNDDWGTLNCDGEVVGVPWHECIRDDNGRVLEWEWTDKDMPHDKTHPAWRAVLLRRGLNRWECPAPPPRSNPSSDSSVGERDSFITSRPWFQFSISIAEEVQRASRLSVRQMQRANLPRPLQSAVRARWEKQGLWKPEWDDQRPSGRPGWKWRHESPSPEPEEFIRYDPDALEDHLSPSELVEYKRLGPKPPEMPPLEFFPWWLHEMVKEKEEEERLRQEGKPTERPPRYRKTAPRAKATRKRTTPSAEPTRRSSRVPIMQEKRRKELAEKKEKEEQDSRAREAAAVAAAAAKERAKKGKTAVKGARPADQGAKTARKGARTAAKNKKAKGNKTMAQRATAAAKGTKKALARGAKAAAAKRTTRTEVKDTTTTAQRVKATLPATRKTLARGTKTAAKGAKTAAKDTTAPSQDTKAPAQGTKRKRK